MAIPRTYARIVGLAAAAALAVALVAASRGGDGHRLFVVVRDATNVLPGQRLRAAGDEVGTVERIEAIDGGRAARIALRVEDRAWPLPRGTRLRLRWGGTITYSNRYIELVPGPPGAPPLPDGGTLPAADFTVPVEFDQLLSAFTPAVRRGMKAMLDRGGSALRTARAPLRRSLVSAPPALRETSAVIEDLVADSDALATLVRSTDRVVDSVRRADPGIGRLVSGAATTFAATAAEAVSLGSALQETPQTLAAARGTLARADGTLRAVGALSGRLGPGVRALRRLTPPLTGVLRTLPRVGPDARAALATARRAAPSLQRLLARATTLMPRIASIGRQSAAQLQCVRPYTPEIAAFFSTWGDFLSNGDGKDRYDRPVLQVAPFNNAQTADSATIVKQNPGLSYAYPRPPGLNAGQPWLVAECGLGPEVFDPQRDPEARPAARGRRR